MNNYESSFLSTVLGIMCLYILGVLAYFGIVALL